MLFEKLKEISISKYKVTIALIDAVNMYLSAKLTTINKAARYFSGRITIATNIVRQQLTTRAIPYANKDNQQERVILNQVGDPNNNLDRNFLPVSLSWD